MEKIKLNDQTYFFPNNWADISLKIFLEIRELELHKEKMDFYEFAMKYINIISSIEVDELRALKKEDLTTVIQKMMTLWALPMEQIDHPIFNFNGTYYVFDTNISFGQYIDLDTITKGKEWWSIANEIAAVFIRPAELKIWKNIKRRFKKTLLIEDFDIEPYNFDTLKERADIFMEYLPMDYIVTCKAFFLNLRVSSEKTIQ